MNKTTIFLSSVLFVTVGCNTQQVMETVSKKGKDTYIAAVETLNSNGNSKQQSQSPGEDVEDASCAGIAYEKHTACKIQVHLNLLGYKVGTADGIAGKNTKRGIKQFQSKNDINPVDGKPSPELLAILRKASATRNINTGANMAIAGAVCGAGATLYGKDTSTTVLAAGGCAAVAGAVSEVAKSGKRKYADVYYKLKDENENMENEINQIAKQTQLNKDKTRSYKSEITNLIANEKDDKAFNLKANDLRALLDKQARKNKRERSQAKATITILYKKINHANQLLAKKPKEQEYKKLLVALNTKKATLIDAIDQSNGIEKELIAQKSILDNEIVERS